MSLAAPLHADVRAGVDAWSRGDYAAAIAEWEGPAAAGDPDAMFNLAQAYRLGRGVARDEGRALSLYRRAAEAGHPQAADTYGLMMFQDGQRAEALPYVQSAARRGDPRAQYLLGIAHFNGDLVERDWERAYALLTLANATGLPQASTAIAQMDRYIPLDQRQRGAALARRLESEAVDARSVELTAADLSVQGAPVSMPSPSPTRADASPSVAAARDAVMQARIATGTASPADAGVSYALRDSGRAAPSTTTVAAASHPVSSQNPDANTSPERMSRLEVSPANAARQSGPWRIQLGAFSVDGNAERLWNRLSNRAEIAGRERRLIPAGRLTKLQAVGYASRADAQDACNSLRRSGYDCLVTRD
ncbi:sporulation protein [Aurantiacibacter spongiae]|uniref:Sporulation protein n=2 Tax=Aurantiacibacter spongiae TaxID=2488860 RepID=A0A3N5DPE4_9SPHN|nr:sporulation protein [Aurantiacibacter spongiae]